MFCLLRSIFFVGGYGCAQSEEEEEEEEEEEVGGSRSGDEDAPRLWFPGM